MQCCHGQQRLPPSVCGRCSCRRRRSPCNRLPSRWSRRESGRRRERGAAPRGSTRPRKARVSKRGVERIRHPAYPEMHSIHSNEADPLMTMTVSVNQNPSATTWRQGETGFAIACRLLSKGGFPQEDHLRSRCQLHTLLPFFSPFGTEAVAAKESVRRFKRSFVEDNAVRNPTSFCGLDTALSRATHTPHHTTPHHTEIAL